MQISKDIEAEVEAGKKAVDWGTEFCKFYII